MLARLFAAIISDCSRQQAIIPFYFLARTWLGCQYREPIGMRKVVTPLLRCDYLLPPRDGMCVCALPLASQ